VGGDGSEQRRVNLCPGAAEGDEGAVADPRDRTVLETVGQEGRRVIVNSGCRAERGRRNQGPVDGEVVAEQPHAVARLAEDVAGADGHIVEAQLAPGPAGQARRGDQSAGQARRPGVEDGSGELPAGAVEEQAEHGSPRSGGLVRPGKSGGRYVCELVVSLLDSSAL
jgi:hypothetical protein